MKRIIFVVSALLLMQGCKSPQATTSTPTPVIAALDLINVEQDKVMVSITPGKITSEKVIFYIPKIVPGTYATADFGKYIEGIKALDAKGNELGIIALDDNSWEISNAKKLDKVIYWVNDTFDIEGEGGIYSMAGTNIKAGENYLLNLHGFVGYFDNMTEEAYRLEITRPDSLFGGSAMEVQETVSLDGGNKKDIFYTGRYFDVTDNPIMYAVADTATFKVDNMDVLLQIYSPNKKFTAADLKPAMEKMVTAQKQFLGKINSTNKYAILLYLSATPGEGDAGNFGALEHQTSTVVVMPETMEQEGLQESLIDIVSHEFFHILTPLGVQSNEIHFFDFNDPKMSQHLWLYEGVTEYFANLFQVNQNLISKQQFYDRMDEKIKTSMNFDDTMPFTELSKNILEEPYKNSYYNVYLKGALIGMALDIRLRELSDGKMGILNLLQQLSQKYGKDKPFEDDALFPVIVELTYPEIEGFLNTYISGTTPIPYAEFFKKVGLEMREGMMPVDYFLENASTPYIAVNSEGSVVVRNDLELNTFFTHVGLKAGDQIKAVNGKDYSIQNIYELITDSVNWKVGDQISISIERDGTKKELKSTVIEPMAKGFRLIEMMNANSEQIELRHNWLKS